jgi:hypothetical protein
MANIKGFYKAGNAVLCIAIDLGAGQMSAYSSHSGADASDSSAWSTVYDGLALSEVVGVGLFPAVSGMGGASIRYRSAGELRAAPPSGGFLAAGAAGVEQVRVRLLRRWVANSAFRR